MAKGLFLSIVALPFLVGHADCDNVHCEFEYLGHSQLQTATKDDFERCSVNDVGERYFMREIFLFKEMNWRLFCLERAVASGTRDNVSNAVDSVVEVERDFSELICDKSSNRPRRLILRWQLDLIEKVEYSLARMILGETRKTIMPFVETLLPDEIIDSGKGIPSWHSIVTFKRMLILSNYVQEYEEKEGCLPLSLNQVMVSERFRKCACGRDIEYEQYDRIWILRSRCESYSGGLGFDAYMPMVFHQRKRLDLCLSSTFNEKRQFLFDGRDLSKSDLRLKGHVVHDGKKNCVHNVSFSDLSVGATRQIPQSEIQNAK